MSRAITCLLIGLLILLQGAPNFAQKWGNITKEELELNSVQEDPEADAVVLFDIGAMRITTNFDLNFKRHCRIKILTERGKKYADISIPYWYEDNFRRLNAQTIQPDGKKIKLDKKNIFEESADRWKQKVFSMPAIQIGSIIEYEYEKVSDYLTYLEPWYFQNEEFTKVSELSILLPIELSYQCFFNEIASLEPQKEKVLDPDRPQRNLYKFTWRKENLPAIKTEPYMTTVKDYLQAIYFQLLAYRDPFTYFQFAKTWDDLAKIVRENYDKLFTEDKSLKEVIVNIIPDSIKGIDRANTIYDFVLNDIRTTSDQGLMSDRLKKTSQVLKEKAGSAVEKNLLLIDLLRIGGFKAQPVLISTRDHGRIHENWVQLQQFNHLIVHLNDGRQSYFLDSQSKYCPFCMLPPEDLVGKGLLIEDKSGKIITIPVPRQVNMKYSDTKASLDENGDLRCYTILRYEAYQGIDEREQLSEKTLDEYVKNILTARFGEVTIDSFQVNHVDLVDSPLTIEMHYQVPNYAQVVDDMIYLCPVLLNRRESNPFTRKSRNFPVEYTYTITTSENVEFKIPQGYQVIETPNPISFGIQGLKYISNCTSDPNKIQYNRYFSTGKSFFHINEYLNLRNSYEQILTADQCQVVLKRMNR